MSSKGISPDDLMKIIIAGGIGIFTLSFYMIQMCCKCKKFKNKKREYKPIPKEEKILNKKEESKSEEINNDLNDNTINIEEKKQEKKIVKKRIKNKNKENKDLKKEERNLDFVINDNRDGEWETVGTKKSNLKEKELKEEDKQKAEKYYNDYLNNF